MTLSQMQTPTTTTFASWASDRLVSRVDPQRWLPRLMADVERAASLDLKVHAAIDALADRFGGRSIMDQRRVGTVLWASLRSRLRAGLDPDRVTTAFTDGSTVLAHVEIALDDFLSQEALDDLVIAHTEMTASDSGGPADLMQGASELQRFLDDFEPPGGERSIFVVAVLAGIGLAVVQCEIECHLHGHGGPITGGHHGPPH